LLAFGVPAIALGVFILFHELHSKQVDLLYTIVGLGVGIVWLACIILGFRGNLIGIFGAGLIAFVELGVISQGHFASSSGAIGSFVRMEGLPVAAALMGLVLACVITIMAALVGWGHATGYSRGRGTLPLLIVAMTGALLAILEATDNVHLAGIGLPGFGKTTAEDGAFVAALTATLWLIGALWIAWMRRTGAILVAAATFGICYSFVIAVAVAILAAASLLAALVFLAFAVLAPSPATSAPAAPAAQRASR
jgi:hypothetical protein